MKKSVAVIVLLFLLALGIVFSANSNKNNDDGKVDKEVEESLKQNNEVSVIVVLQDSYSAVNTNSVSALSEKDGDFRKKKIMVAEQQENVLSNLNYEEVLLNKEETREESLKAK